MFSVGDTVEVRLKGFPKWNGLIGTVEEHLSWDGYRIRFPEVVDGMPHSDPYILQLSPGRLKLVFPREPDWEV
jgi:hypothetical protein